MKCHGRSKRSLRDLVKVVESYSQVPGKQPRHDRVFSTSPFNPSTRWHKTSHRKEHLRSLQYQTAQRNSPGILRLQRPNPDLQSRPSEDSSDQVSPTSIMLGAPHLHDSSSDTHQLRYFRKFEPDDNALFQRQDAEPAGHSRSRSKEEPSSSVEHPRPLRLHSPANANYRSRMNYLKQRENHRQQARLARLKDKYPDTLLRWRPILDMLDAVTPEGPENYVPRLQAVQLRHGIQAVFDGNAGARVLEVMKCTGCHVQALAGGDSTEQSDVQAFHTLTLWGTPSQIEKAVELLPTMLQLKDASRHDSGRDQAIHNSKDMNKSVQRSDLLTTTAALTETDANDRDGHFPRHHYPERQYTHVSPSGVATSAIRAPIRATWVRSHSLRSLQDILRFRPTTWTILNLAAYVDDLTTSQPRLRRRRQIPSNASQLSSPSVYAEEVAKELQAIVGDNSDTVRALCSEVVDKIFSFLLRNELINTLREVFAILEQSSTYKLTASNFEHLLRKAAVHSDLPNFKAIVQTMIRHKVQPSWDCWLAFHLLVFRCFGATAGRIVTQRMQRKGILANIKAKRGLVANTIVAEFWSYTAREDRTLGDFFRYLDKKYPKTPYPGLAENFRKRQDWWSTLAANRLAQSLLMRGRRKDALTVVRELEASGAQIDKVTVEIFLTADAHARDPSATVALLREHHIGSTKCRIQITEKTYESLFLQAWQTGNLNMARVVWRYGCMSGSIPYKAQKIIRRSLLNYLPPQETREKLLTFARAGPDKRKDERLLSRTPIFWNIGGKFVLGVSDHPPMSKDSGGDKRTTSGHIISEVDVNALQSLTNLEEDIFKLSSILPETDSQDHHHRQQRFHGMFMADVEHGPQYKPLVPLYVKLEEAWRLDRRWEQDKHTLFLRAINLSTNDLTDLDPELRIQAIVDILQRLLRMRFERGVRIPVKKR